MNETVSEAMILMTKRRGTQLSERSLKSQALRRMTGVVDACERTSPGNRRMANVDHMEDVGDKPR